MSKVSDAAERGKMVVTSYFGYADGNEDITKMLADVDAYLESTGRVPIDAVSVYAHQMHLARKRDDEVWERT